MVVLIVVGCVTVTTRKETPRWVWYRVGYVVSPVMLYVKGVGLVRLRGVLEPEPFSLKPGRFWHQAVETMRRLTEGKLVRMEPPPWGPLPKDSFHKADVLLRLSDMEQMNLAAEMVRLGLLRLGPDWKRTNYGALLVKMEQEARLHRRGIWGKNTKHIKGKP